MEKLIHVLGLSWGATVTAPSIGNKSVPFDFWKICPLPLWHDVR